MHPSGLLAHPLTQADVLPVSPVVVATVAVLLVLAVAAVLRPGGVPDAASVRLPWRSVTALPPAVSVARAAGVALLLFVLAVARLGDPRDLENLAPALFIGAGWPLLLLACAAFGDLFDWIDPFDTIARVASDDERPAEPSTVWWAVVPTVGWAWYYAVYPQPLQPRALAAALLVYLLFVAAGTIAAGRRWLAGAEMVALLCAWAGRLPRRRLARWIPPSGTALLLGVLLGGTVFFELRTSTLWALQTRGAAGTLRSSLGFVLLAGVAGGALHVLDARARRRGCPGGVVPAAIVATIGVTLALALRSGRLITSLRILPALLGDPFGQGWDLLGPVSPAPAPGPATILWAQVGIVALAGMAAAAVSVRLAGTRAQAGPAVTAAVMLVVLATLLVTVV